MIITSSNRLLCVHGSCRASISGVTVLSQPACSHPIWAAASGRRARGAGGCREPHTVGARPAGGGGGRDTFLPQRGRHKDPASPYAPSEKFLCARASAPESARHPNPQTTPRYDIVTSAVHVACCMLACLSARASLFISLCVFVRALFSLLF